MKLERLSENQIRCTLDKADLADRELLLNELAYGTDRAKELFRDMMAQAADELGFEVNDIPLMIEAIPVSPECLILIITKVEDPEELDTRFSRFSKYTDIEIEAEEDNSDSSSEEKDEDSLELFNSAASLMETISDIVENIEQVKKQTETGQNANFIPLSAALRESSRKKAEKAKESKKSNTSTSTYRIFSFQNINDISKAAVMVAPIYQDDNSLYKSPFDSRYYLIVNNQTDDAENYQRVCNLLSEYGTKVKATYAMPYYFAEHFKIIIKKDALQTLASI
ncbi:MAG: adaptor protein MecA [Lachnospiraceae bacterium]|nr:adaptor protein MecA [Lachnospiraceae bacterium]MDE6625772.1 adaptor protein MecA [Lachnospiraceae bacterium]